MIGDENGEIENSLQSSPVSNIRDPLILVSSKERGSDEMRETAMIGSMNSLITFGIEES